ncbi:hypothetical protein HDU92_002629 [Lobulomyces angularis]|nr:hypothetical protein HDU92_002629 [Lobulomyces angularis]
MAFKKGLINGHFGVSQDIIYALSLFNLTYTQIVDPRRFAPYGHSKKYADYLNNVEKLGDYFCDNFETVIVGDTIPDSRFLLQRLDEETYRGKCHIKKLILFTTARFDYGLNIKDDTEDYYKLLKNLMLNENTSNRIFWFANNPWEIKYAKIKLDSDILNFRLVRSFGVSNFKLRNITKEDSEMPVLISYPNTREFEFLLKKNFDFKLLSKNAYGGGVNLAQYKCLIQIPYQVSTMKMYENLRAGVITIIPSKRYLKFLMNVPSYELSAVKDSFEKEGQSFDYIDYYSKELNNFFYEFDTLEELKAMVSKSKEELDYKNVRLNGPLYWKIVNLESERSWKNVLFS